MWLVDPRERSIEVFVNAGDGFSRQGRFLGGDLVHSTVLAELEFPVASMFRGPRS
jgi:Uma2 family endonuclease